MKTTRFIILMLAACIGLGRSAFSQEAKKTRDRLSWAQLASQMGMAGLLQAKAPDEFKVEALILNPMQVWYVTAEIELTAGEWTQFTEGKGLSNLGLFSYWCHGELEPRQRDLAGPNPLSDGTVDISKIPAKNYHICLFNEEAEEARLYVLVPAKDGKSGSLFYFYFVQRLKSVTADAKPPAK